MPKIVDHEARREEVAEATWRVIAREGIEATTIKAIAKETGFSTGIFAHYFKNKNELLRYALELASLRMGARMWKKGEKASGREVLREVLLEAMPLDEERQLEWRIWVTFWGRAVSDASMAEEQRRWYVEYRSLLRSLILDGQRNGYFRADMDAQMEADSIVALVAGIGMQATMEPQRFPPEHQIVLLEKHLLSLRSSQKSNQPLEKNAAIGLDPGK